MLLSLTRTGLVCGLLFCGSWLLTAQTPSPLTELGAVPLELSFTSDDQSIAVTQPYLIRRAHYRYNWEGDAGYGYGYASVHLEFAADAPLRTRTVRGEKNVAWQIRFFDAADELLASFDLADSRIRHFGEDQAKYQTYSIELINLPLVYFEIADRIDIRFYDSKWSNRTNSRW